MWGTDSAIQSQGLYEDKLKQTAPSHANAQETARCPSESSKPPLLKYEGRVRHGGTGLHSLQPAGKGQGCYEQLCVTCLKF